MPILTTYPGVYVEEIASGVNTITGVATSIGTALVLVANSPGLWGNALSVAVDYQNFNLGVLEQGPN